MAYNYNEQKHELFTEDGIDILMKVKENINTKCDVAGAVMLNKLLDGVTGDTFTMLAAIDYLIEKGELREVTPPDTRGQERVYVRVAELYYG